MGVVLRELRRGHAAAIFAMGTEEECQVLDFLQELAKDDPGEAARTWALIKRTADHGTPRAETKCRFFRKIKVFEFKTRGGVRVMAFWDEDQVIICSHGFVKKSQKTPKTQLERATTLRNEYLTAKTNGQLVYND
ncbi:MAG: type II toxin-antitoxin system RelE/ParE family toxin [Planctomycetes bacterium]|nr:type II toxin-antitoxin system RelE/ParE family toxin [Planctomycetota bacterium]